MAKTITFAIQKGGVSKTTTTGITAALLAKEGHSVLACDMDSQGNLTQLLTRRSIYDFEEQTILEAMQDGDARPYIQDTELPGVKILTADDVLITLARWLYTDPEGRQKNPLYILQEALEPVQSSFDYILIDTPPNLGEQTQAALMAADSIVTLFEPSEWTRDALDRFVKFTDRLSVRTSHQINVAGILRNLNDARRSDMKAYNETIAELYPKLIFETVIKRNAAAGRIPLYGLVPKENPELKDALEPYLPFLKELKSRI